MPEFTVTVAQLRERMRYMDKYLRSVNQETPIVVKARGEVSNLHALTLTPRNMSVSENGEIVLDPSKMANTIVLFVE
jgi:CO dehydrogenase/acetyl-CoA synthase gamma subunit (corrinoid Fe-S protein)